MKQLTILVDMDDTMEHLVAAWTRRLNERYGTSVHPEDITTWNIPEAFPGLTEEQVFGVISEPDFWGTVEPTEGAAETLQRFIAAGHRVFIATANDYQTVRQKMELLLFRYFPFISWKQVVIISCKQLLRGDVLIDDGVHNLLGGEYEKILMDMPHNRGFDAEANGMLRVYNWKEIEEAVNRLAETGRLS